MRYKVLLRETGIILLLVLTFCLVYTKVLCAEASEKISRIIKKVEIKGNQRISTAAIKSSIRVKEGDTYDPQIVSQDVDAIWSMGFFDNIEVELEEIPGGLKLIFAVTERTVIDEIQFDGNEKIKTKKLKKQIEIKEGDYLKHYLLKLDEDKIREFYIKKCFPRVQVQAESKIADGRSIVVFHIDEGPKIRIAKIKFEGNTGFKRKKLLKQMEIRRKRFPTFIFPGRFDKKTFESDINKLKEFYMNNGWLDVEIGWEIAYKNHNKMYIIIHIKEGERYYVENVKIEGENLFTEEELKEKLKLKEGGPFFLDAVDKDTYQIRLAYGEQGYIGARVEERHTFSSEGTKVNVFFTIDEKDRHYIEKIKILGNDKTRDNVIRRQLTFYPGEKLDTEKIRDSQRRLTNTGYFDMESGVPAGINFEPGSEANKQNILVEVKEGRTGMLRFGGGYGANVGAFGDISYTDRNFDVTDLPKSWNDFLEGNAFRGAGEVLTLRFSPGFQRTEILASLTNPAVFDSPYSAGLSLFSYLRWYREYQQQSSGSRVSLGREIQRDFFVRVSPEFSVINIKRQDEKEDTPQDVLDVAGSHLKAGITLSALINRTDNIYAPMRGYEGDSSLEFAGMDVDIVKYKIQTTRYHPLFDVPKWGKHVFMYGGTFGVVESTSGEDVPIFERFFAGGYGSLRGFDYRGVAPVDEKTEDQIGGNLLMLMNAEYIVPLYKDIIRAAFFIDSGKADRGISDINFDRFRVSMGVGLRLSIPFLGRSTISIDYGIPVMKEAADEVEAFSFNFGGGGSY
ncbi:MAG: outer membrane protein assembly factor BamA [Candidatus Jettenia sp.]|uniref:Outer membrane protein assembly factor BamA n=1 Tax=Candidatus Jettenia caeni TaxID=247490 RepID=I3II64_9BACT|nr:outer membrane protein assembly factor BamA [Candidatus Jettenia sp. AMX1]MBC6929247.1 outer membrane protein assembly factor BamA [Candidatus Jettenia sp.]NUN22369.1 outer membrane protein assembly factor BamA [Candidatus Jettenia caeni]KAA0250991.1 MAG: outer membrane protein assembly factor BamA [Candidatus Jettenia sp. AMX1]MCE7880216.1 outer membrane protein assembly factor BamA [Candidatus Jettenia sp. AMX1]MCQ3926360.1 outer membrane protein assembly factor BamA [Candidatus Jettenia 